MAKRLLAFSGTPLEETILKSLLSLGRTYLKLLLRKSSLVPLRAYAEAFKLELICEGYLTIYTLLIVTSYQISK